MGNIEEERIILQSIIEEYCGITLTALLRLPVEDYYTAPFWTETGIEPGFAIRLIVELLHRTTIQGEL